MYSHFEDKLYFSSGELFLFIQSEFPNLAKKTINWKINQLKSIGILSHLSRGIYSLKKKNDFTPEIPPYLKRINSKIKKELPYLNFCIWDSRWFNEFMVHQIFRYYIVVETEKDATNSVFNSLTEFSKKVFLDPNKDIYSNYIINHNEVIIVMPLISESPLLEIDNIKTPSIEKLLIDCLIDTDLFAAQQDELDNIYQSAFNKYFININKIKRYARRRNQLIEFENKVSMLNLNP